MSTVCLYRRVFMAEVSGGRVHGRPRLGWMDGVKVAINCCLVPGFVQTFPMSDSGFTSGVGRNAVAWGGCGKQQKGLNYTEIKAQVPGKWAKK